MLQAQRLLLFQVVDQRDAKSNRKEGIENKSIKLQCEWKKECCNMCIERNNDLENHTSVFGFLAEAISGGPSVLAPSPSRLRL